MTSVAELMNVSFSAPGFWRSTPILRDLSFTLREGSVCGLVGHNGAGKSTMIRIMIGLLQPTQGTVKLFGAPPAQMLHKVGYAADPPELPPEMTCRELIELHAALRGMPARASEVLETVSLGAVAHRTTAQLSKGMRQRLSLAIAALGRPPLLIVDEPMSGLDPEGRAWVRSFIREQANEGVTVLFSSHVLADVEELCSHLAVVRQGAISHSGPMTEFLGGERAVRVQFRCTDSARALALGAQARGDAFDVAFSSLSAAGAGLQSLLSIAGFQLLELDVERRSLTAALEAHTTTFAGGTSE